MATVTFDHATRIYPGNDRPSVDALNLAISDGEFLVLVGPSGCGKSTSLRMLAGLEDVNSGRILIGDKDVTDVQPKDRDIAMVFQNYALYPHMSVHDNMGFALKIAGTPKAEIDKRVKEAAKILGLTEYLDGTTSSSLNEVRLGHEKFGGETHGYSVAWAPGEVTEAARLADKLIFNSISQLKRLSNLCGKTPLGLRLNPGVSNSPYLLADPARPNSRLGESDPARIEQVADLISGVMIHNNCENRSLEQFSGMLDRIERTFGPLLKRLSWVSLGGGIHYTAPGYPLEALADRLRTFADRMQVQVYLEPGEAAVTGAATLEVTVLDVLERAKPIAIIDASIEAHMLDLLTYELPARVLPDEGPWRCQLAGNTCLAGDIFGEFSFPHPLRPGDRISLQDAAGYTMVKKNWFNGVPMPAIAVRRLDGRIEMQRRFGYEDYRDSLS